MAMEKGAFELEQNKPGNGNSELLCKVQTDEAKKSSMSFCSQCCCCCLWMIASLIAFLALCAGVAAIVLIVVYPNVTSTVDENVTRINAEVVYLREQMELQKAEVAALQQVSQALMAEVESGLANAMSKGAVYTRWGSSSCPNVSGTEIVYTGIVGGSGATEGGGGANYLCMPNDPEYVLPHIDGSQGYSNIRGTQYGFPVDGTHITDPVCAVCFVKTRSVVLTLPAKVSCPQSWTKEYEGYLMSGGTNSAHYRATFVCVDKDLEIIPGSEGNLFPIAHFWHAEATCESFSCPPYNSHQEVNCAVCTY